MKEITIDVKTSLPKIESNFSAATRQLENILKEYDLIVDADSVKTAKSMAMEISKLKAEIASRRKQIVSELSKPLGEFEESAKKLESLCESSRQKLQSQVKVFEDEKREECKKLLRDELVVNYKHLEVREEFQSVVTDDLAIISNMTKKGLAKKAYTAIESRVFEVKKFQDKIDKRLLTLEGDCFKAGLDAPLTKENISHFLLELDDEAYANKLRHLISNEITRINLMNERMREKEEEKKIVFEKEQNPQPLKQPQECNVIVKSEKLNEYSHFKNLHEFGVPVKQNTKVTYVATAVFEVEVDKKLGPKLKDMLVKKFAEADFKQVPSVYIQEKEKIA